MQTNKGRGWAELTQLPSRQQKKAQRRHELIEAGGWILLPIGLSVLLFVLLTGRLWSCVAHSPECLCSPNRSTDQRQETPRCSGPMFGISCRLLASMQLASNANLERSQLREPVEGSWTPEARSSNCIELIGTCAAISPPRPPRVVGMMAVFQRCRSSGRPGRSVCGCQWHLAGFDYHRRWPRGRDSPFVFLQASLE